MAIIDEWYDPDPATDPRAPRGINVRIYDAESAEWKMMWVSTATAQMQDLRARVIDGVLTMWQVYPERPDFRAEFEVIDATRWQRVQFQRNGDEWTPLVATRLPCAAAP